MDALGLGTAMMLKYTTVAYRYIMIHPCSLPVVGVFGASRPGASIQVTGTQQLLRFPSQSRNFTPGGKGHLSRIQFCVVNLSMEHLQALPSPEFVQY